jgi:hypothetical protein
MKKIFSILLFSGATFLGNAQMQTDFITAGKIKFERKTNVHRLYFTGRRNGQLGRGF